MDKSIIWSECKGNDVSLPKLLISHDPTVCENEKGVRHGPIALAPYTMEEVSKNEWSIVPDSHTHVPNAFRGLRNE